MKNTYHKVFLLKNKKCLSALVALKSCLNLVSFEAFNNVLVLLLLAHINLFALSIHACF